MNLPGQVVFATDPQVIHPLSGEMFRLRELASDQEAKVEAIKAMSFDHFRQLIVPDAEGRADWRRIFLKLWRFGPAPPANDLVVLWNMLPADTRSPDHTIWEHLKLTSAFAGALAADGSGPALLLMSFGPVQGFIAQARSVSDLWAGSHLLSRIAWEAMQIVCKKLGPDAVLFPDLNGVAMADLWLQQELGTWPSEVPRPWAEIEDDTNPLFAAALPNRFVAFVPAGEAETLAGEIVAQVRGWAKKEACKALTELLEAAGRNEAAHARTQIERQFSNFPEVHWVVLPWTLAGETTLDDGKLKDLLARLGAGREYLDPKLDGLLRSEITVEAHPFFTPNPGTAYPGLFEALERLHAAAKAARPFDGTVETGYRCTLCGEREWLTDDEALLTKPTGERKGRSLWTEVAHNKPALAKEGEHLCGVCALKRAWPRLFVKETASMLPKLDRLDRFVLSTRAVAMSTSLWRWLERGKLDQWQSEQDKAFQRREGAVRRLRSFSLKDKHAALPKRLYVRLRHELNDEDLKLVKALPRILDEVNERADDTNTEQQARDLETAVYDFLGVKPETYYALVLMDGDNMGAWLAGETGQQKMRDRFHETTRAALEGTGTLSDYLAAERPASPARHQAISTALNGFALHLARVVVEDLFMGKLIYAGGDDLMAMVAVHDLPGMMLALRCAYSGVMPTGWTHEAFWQWLTGEPQNKVKVVNGFSLLAEGKHRRILRLMGTKATSSIGAIVAHHQSPLSRVIRDLRAAEQRAKGVDGKDAFCITIDKRAGGTHHLVGRWRLDAGMDGDMGLLLDLRDLIAKRISRRVVYLSVDRLRDVPATEEALRASLGYQFNRQAGTDDAKAEGIALAGRLARVALAPAADRRKNKGEDGTEDEWLGPNRWLREMLLTAEFLAREGRVGGETPVVGPEPEESPR